MQTRNKRSLCAAVAALLLCRTAPAAGAAKLDPGLAPKGTLSVGSTELDRSAYVDASAYDDPPVEVETVRIGLDYGEGAAEEAVFVDPSGAGFLLGSYGEDRQFTELARTEASEIHILCLSEGHTWHILLEQSYLSRREAAEAAASYGGFSRKIAGEYRVLYGSYDSREEAEAARDRFRLPGAAYTPEKLKLLVTDAAGETVYEPEDSQVALFPLGEGLTQYAGERYRGGFACLPGTDGRLTVINYVGLEDYVKGVLPYEMGNNWPFEALRAQAVCARTYVVYNQDQYGEQGFDITDDTYSQVYRGTLEANENTDAAAESTAGLLLRYRGEICETYYSAADGGATEDGSNVFDADRPYLTGKPDPFEEAVDYAAKSWTVTRSAENIAARLAGDGYELGTVSALEPELSDTGNVIAIHFLDADGGEALIQGRRCYTILGLNSPRFTIEQKADGSFTFTGSGLGHSCGMSQWGAYAMAKIYGYDCEDILRFYFTGAYMA